MGPSKSVLVYARHSLKKPPRPCSISGVCAKIIIIIMSNIALLTISFQCRGLVVCCGVRGGALASHIGVRGFKASATVDCLP